ncbi:MAG: TonB-dependent receptor [Hyphomicrobiaceae bacterium]|nr:TonB-dependent receptor [Hyphomicrobiaceae bacterium]
MSTALHSVTSSKFGRIIWLGLVCYAAPLASATAQQVLPGIVVSGGTLDPGVIAPTGEGQPGRDTPGIPTERIGSSVTVVSGEQLRAAKVRDAGEALRSLPGVHVSQQAGPGSLTNVRIRGGEANHTLVLIDGIEANVNSDGAFDFSDLLVDDIERIEVIRGGHSGIYGSKAIGGVINIITKSGRGPITAQAAVDGGGFRTRGVAARVSGGNDKAWLSGSAQYRRSEGFNVAPRGSENDPWWNRTLALKGGFRPIAGVQVDFSLRHTKKYVSFDQEQFNALTGLNEATDANNRSLSEMFLGGAQVRWDLFKGAFTQILRASHNHTDLNSVTTFGQTQNISTLTKYGYLATYRFTTPMLLAARHSISGLVEKETEGFTPRASFTDGRERTRERLATVGEYRGEYLRRFHFAATVRHDDNTSYRDFTTWRTSISVPVPEVGIRPHASVGTSVALPGMFEQFGSILGTFTGNPNLVPEESFGWDAGVEFTLPGGKTKIDFTYFHANLKNEIRGFGNTLSNLQGESQRQGIEIALKSQLTTWLYFGASYTFLDAEEPSGKQEIRRPRHSGKASVTAKFHEGRGTFHLAALYNGRMKDDNFGTFPATVVTLNDYVLVNAAVSYKVHSNVEVFARVQNLLNQNYQEISGYNTPGIAAYAGVRFKFVDPSTLAWAKYR